MKRSVETLLHDGFILVYNQDKLDVVKTAEALMQAGISNMEVTCRIQKPLEKIERLHRELPEMTIGAASLIDFPEMLDTYNQLHSGDQLPNLAQVVDAGADYLVSAAAFRKESYDAYANRLPMIPGCASTTEILTQYSMGANFCKIFPAAQCGGPAFIKSVDPALHKMISMVPTGGTNSKNIPEYIAAGVLVVGASFSMIDKSVMAKVVDEQDYGALAAEFAKLKEQIDRQRAQMWPSLDWASCSAEDVTQATGRHFNL